MKNQTRKKIMRLYQSGASMRRIARESKTSRYMVKRVLSGVDVRIRKKRRSLLDDYEEAIKKLLARNPNTTAVYVHDELKKQGFTGGLTVVRERVNRIAGRKRQHRELAKQELKIWLFDISMARQTQGILNSELRRIAHIELILERARNGSLAERKRALAILARSKGVSERLIADCLDWSRHAVSKSCRANSRDDADGVFRFHAGYPSDHEGRRRVTKALTEILHQKPNAYGINRSSWTHQSLADAYQSEYGQRISSTTVRTHLKDAGYSWKKSRRVLTSPDPEYREKVELLLETLQSLRDDERFFFIDELGPLQVKRYGGRCHTPRNQPLTHPQKPRSKGSITLYGALSATTNQVTWLYEEAKDTTGIIDLAEVLFNQHHDKAKIYITWDAASWHRSNQLAEWVDDLNARSTADGTGPVIELVPLPHCAQFLNVIEAVFSSMKRAVIHNSDYQSEEEMKTAISRHFRERNDFFRDNPRRAGKKIWEIDFFNDFRNMRAGNYREW